MNDITSFLQAPSKMNVFAPAAAALSSLSPAPRKYRPASNSITAKINTSRRAPKPALSVAAPDPNFIIGGNRTMANRNLVGGGNVASMQRSFNPADGLRALRRHRWNVYDIQHFITALFVLFSFVIAPIPIVIDVAVVAGYMLLLLMPATRQFFLPSLPIWAYLFYFFASRYVYTFCSGYLDLCIWPCRVHHINCDCRTAEKLA